MFSSQVLDNYEHIVESSRPGSVADPSGLDDEDAELGLHSEYLGDSLDAPLSSAIYSLDSQDKLFQTTS